MTRQETETDIMMTVDPGADGMIEITQEVTGTMTGTKVVDMIDTVTGDMMNDAEEMKTMTGGIMMTTKGVEEMKGGIDQRAQKPNDLLI